MGISSRTRDWRDGVMETSTFNPIRPASIRAMTRMCGPTGWIWTANLAPKARTWISVPMNPTERLGRPGRTSSCASVPLAMTQTTACPGRLPSGRFRRRLMRHPLWAERCGWPPGHIRHELPSPSIPTSTADSLDPRVSGTGGTGLRTSRRLTGGPVVSVVTITAGGGVSAIDGFTIRNGVGTASDSGLRGGGIYCSFSAPSIANNTITANTAAHGGGIQCYYASP